MNSMALPFSGNGLLLFYQQRISRTGIDGDIVTPRRFAYRTDKIRPHHRLPRNRGNPHEFTFLLLQQIGKANGVVDVVADVGVQQYFDHTYPLIFYSPPGHIPCP
jgi:hypothetical protein